jgi:purine nucleoside phosphorylase
LRGFVEAKGGHVIGMTTLTETRAARQAEPRAAGPCRRAWRAGLIA